MMCAHLQCERPATAKKLCAGHYDLMRQGRSIAKPLDGMGSGLVPILRQCRVNGCFDVRTSYSLCGKHYAEIRAMGRPA